MRRRALIALVFVVAASVGFESWQATAHAADAGGRPAAWFWPVTLEAFLGVLVLVYWDARSEARKAPGARTLLALTTLACSAIQVLDAPHAWLGWLTAGWTPVALMLSVELATWLLYGTKPRTSTLDVPPPAPLPTPNVREEAPTTTLVRPSRKVRALNPKERRQVDALMLDGKSANAIAKQTRIAYAPVNRYVQTHKPSTNGHKPKEEIGV